MSYYPTALPPITGPYSSFNTPTFGPAIPLGPASMSPGIGGIAGLPGSSGGVLARGLPGIPGAAATQALSSPVTSYTPAFESFVPAVESTAAKGFGARLAGMGPAYAAGRASLPGVLGAAGMKGSLARGAAPLVTGFIADKAFGTDDENKFKEAARGFTRGAGWGAVAAPVLASTGVGLAGLPLLAAAAGITGTIGAAADVLDLGRFFGGGGEDEDPKVAGEEVIAKAIDGANLSPEITAQILDTYEARLQFASAIEDDAEREAAEAAALNEAGMYVIEAIQSGEQATQSASNVLAMQQQANETFAPIAQDMRASGQQYAATMEQLIPMLPESQRAAAQVSAARGLNLGNQLSDAYAAQAAIAPTMAQLTQYQQDYNSFAAQQFAQALAQQAGGGGAGGAADVSALLPTG